MSYLKRYTISYSYSNMGSSGSWKTTRSINGKSPQDALEQFRRSGINYDKVYRITGDDGWSSPVKTVGYKWAR